ncbi:MAG: toll/interleukin-1 receptor domain-containing protein [Verrucomicrobiae bacterium]|nr:toll/interleukin-1 receptor domain-containing protein [Verrucomicrobiae bacterium]
MKVFLSSAESDREVARELASRLEDAGHIVWFADDTLFPGENWALEVGKALNESEALVVLLSPQAMKSDWVRKEIEFALGARQYRGRLIPVMVKPTADIPWILKRFPIVRLNKGIAEAARQVADYVEHGFELTPAKV